VRRKPRNLKEYLQLPPRWRTLLASFVLIFGLMLFLGTIADSSGTLQPPGADAIIMIAGIVVTACLLVYLDKRGTTQRGK
jgi:ABC-type transport system involved in cytochrome c biogenesis permease subunit